MATMTFPRGMTNRRNSAKGMNLYGQYQGGPYGSAPTMPSWIGPRNSAGAPVIKGVSALKSAEIMNDWRNGKGTSKLQAEQAQDREKAHQAMREMAFEKGYENARRKMGLAGDKTAAAPVAAKPAAVAAPVAKPTSSEDAPAVGSPAANKAGIAGPVNIPAGRMGGSQDVSGQKMSDWLAKQKDRQKKSQTQPQNDSQNDEPESSSEAENEDEKSESAADISARLNKNLTAIKNVQDEVNPAIDKTQDSLNRAQHSLNKTQDAIDAPLDEEAIKARGVAGGKAAQEKMDAEGGVGSPEYMTNLNKASEAAAKNAATEPPAVSSNMAGAAAQTPADQAWRKSSSENDDTIANSLSKMNAESRAKGGPVHAMKHKIVKREMGGPVAGVTWVGGAPATNETELQPKPPTMKVVPMKKGGSAKPAQVYKVGDAKGATKSNPKPELFMPNKKGGSPQVIGRNGPETGTFSQDGVVIPNHALHSMKKKFAAQKAQDDGDESSEMRPQ